ncbi:hypothetical protein JGU71_28305 [Antrihabitans sp. YC3-6]|uniref:Uncharacterized protein n=1 Tax=Antrihabitans stalagmiti TaxID=2799499 RepID=A0A934NWZ6_9NOCA|nr:hypothetical protein [Antrihabitans stalagmiti]MBJ8342799.1 hypothetical protein [Antrihabitans stalagmiti]
MSGLESFTEEQRAEIIRYLDQRDAKIGEVLVEMADAFESWSNNLNHGLQVAYWAIGGSRGKRPREPKPTQADIDRQEARKRAIDKMLREWDLP